MKNSSKSLSKLGSQQGFEHHLFQCKNLGVKKNKFKKIKISKTFQNISAVN
jgi:hypothetical protein